MPSLQRLLFIDWQIFSQRHEERSSISKLGSTGCKVTIEQLLKLGKVSGLKHTNFSSCACTTSPDLPEKFWKNRVSEIPDNTILQTAQTFRERKKKQKTKRESSFRPFHLWTFPSVWTCQIYNSSSLLAIVEPVHKDKEVTSSTIFLLETHFQRFSRLQWPRAELKLELQKRKRSHTNETGQANMSPWQERIVTPHISLQKATERSLLAWFSETLLLFRHSTHCSGTVVDFWAKGSRREIQLENLARLSGRWLLSEHKPRSSRAPWEPSCPPRPQLPCVGSVIALCPRYLMVSSLPPRWYRIQGSARGASISRKLWLKAAAAENHFSWRG